MFNQIIGNALFAGLALAALVFWWRGLREYVKRVESEILDIRMDNVPLRARFYLSDPDGYEEVYGQERDTWELVINRFVRGSMLWRKNLIMVADDEEPDLERLALLRTLLVATPRRVLKTKREEKCQSNTGG